MDRKHNPALTQYARELRKNMTREEKRLWYQFLRNYPSRFQRQKAIGEYIVDFYCAKARIVIELDGGEHYEINQQNKDAVRTHTLESIGLTVIRIPNNEIDKNFIGVCEYIDIVVKQSISPSTASGPPPSSEGSISGSL